MEIRRAIRADGPAVLDLIRSLAAFEKLPPPDAAAEQRLLGDAFDAAPSRIDLWVAADGGRVIAYAVCFATYSTFRGLPSMYLEDLFVDPSARRRGVATAMLAHLREEAERRGCGRFEWTVLDWNEEAKAFYRGLGAEILPDWRIVRIDLRDPPPRRP